MICWKCHEDTGLISLARTDECPSCHADLHVCRMCDFYERGAHNDCREPSAEFTPDKEHANFCDFFRPCLKSSGAGKSGGADGKAQARSAFDVLFSGSGGL